MNTSKMTLLLTALCLLCACSSAPKKDPNAAPDWVLGKSNQYPQSQFITGYGLADNLPLAKDRARADLAKVFSVSIRERLTDSQTAEFNWTHSTKPEERNAIQRDLAASTKQTLKAVATPEAWRDPKTGSFHALAVINRGQMMNQLQLQIDELDASTRQVIRLSNTIKSNFEKVKMASEAINLQKQRSLLQSQMQVVDLSGLGVPAKWTVPALKIHRQEIMSDLKIGSSSSGAFQHEIRSAIDAVLTRQGFTLTRSGNLKISGNMSTQNLGQKNGWYWLTGKLHITVLEDNQRVVGEKSWPIKVSAGDPKLAENRLVQKAENILMRELPQTLFSFMD